MKHTLPVLTLTALAAAASAQVAPAAKQSLSYNRVVASWVHQSGTSFNGTSILAQAKIGSGLYVTASAIDVNNSIFDGTAASIGYAYSLPSILGVATDLNVELGYKKLGAGLRCLIGGGFELGVAYAHGAGSASNPVGGLSYTGVDVLTVEASYSLGFMVKGLSINASYASESNYGWRPGFDTTSIGVGFNF
jgi:hypothetical protein